MTFFDYFDNCDGEVGRVIGSQTSSGCVCEIVIFGYFLRRETFDVGDITLRATTTPPSAYEVPLAVKLMLFLEITVGPRSPGLSSVLEKSALFIGDTCFVIAACGEKSFISGDHCKSSVFSSCTYSLILRGRNDFF